MTDREKLWQLQEGWQSPPELERGRPRPVRYTAAGVAARVFVVLLVAGGLALGVGLYLKATGDQERNRLLSLATGRTEGRITRLWRGGKNNTRCYAAYQFSAAGALVARTGSIACRDWRVLSEGDRREVLYVESNPEIARLEGLERATASPIWLAPLATVFLSTIAFFIARNLARQRRLLEDGRAAAGVVTRLGRRTDKGRTVHYEFLTLGGSKAEGSFGPVPGKAVLAVGTPITVIYDSDDPGFNRRYPLSVVTAKQ